MNPRFICLIVYTLAFSVMRAEAPDSVKTYLWGLIKIKPEQKIEYEKGYLRNRILHPREFYTPVTFIPFEVRYGFDYTGGGGVGGVDMHSGWISYESSVTSFDGGNVSARIGHHLDFDLAKSNLSYYLLNTSWANMHTGLNIRYASVFLPPDLPTEDWGNTNSTWNPGASTFAPKIWEFSLSQSLMAQWFDRWFLNFRYTYGIATLKFYRDEKKEHLKTPTGWGPSASYTAGIRFVLKQTAEGRRDNKFAFGLDLKHTYSKIKNINDPDDVTPISGFTLSNYGLFVTLSILYGGDKTKGDLGKNYYYRKDYAQALKNLEEFVVTYPHHANRHRAEFYIHESRRKIPYQLMREGMKFDERGLTKRALEKYIKARTLADTTLVAALDDRIRQIAAVRLDSAELLLHQGNGERALEILQEVVGFYHPANRLVPRFEGYDLLYRGRKATRHGFYEKALGLFEQAVEKDTSLKFEADLLRQEIAVAMVSDANLVQDLSAVNLVVQNLEQARDISGNLGRENERILAALKSKLALREDWLHREMINNRMETERRKGEIIEEIPKIEIGMTNSQVKSIMGEPLEVIETASAKGENQQMWIFRYEGRRPLELSFLNYHLIKIEER